MLPAKLRTGKKVVGAKQTLKALQNGQITEVYVAKDAEQRVLQPIVDQCKARGVEIIEVDSMAELGKACKIDVGAAVAGIIE